jgi:ribosomal-protein-alanine N-acetyltransferase
MISFVNITRANFFTFADDILEIERSSFASPWSLTSFQDEANRQISRLWGVTSHNRIRGFICYWIFPEEVHLMNIAVHPVARGKGVGQALLNRMIGEGRTAAARTAWLEVRPSNREARTLYTKMGFKEIARRPNYYPDTKEDAVVMALALSVDKKTAQGDERSSRPSVYITSGASGGKRLAEGNRSQVF